MRPTLLTLLIPLHALGCASAELPHDPAFAAPDEEGDDGAFPGPSDDGAAFFGTSPPPDPRPSGPGDGVTGLVGAVEDAAPLGDDSSAAPDEAALAVEA